MRERAHLTQEAAADKAGVTLRAYQKWEAGGGIQYANLQRLADALKTTVEQITGEVETPSPFRVSEQLDDVTAVFHARVDHVEEQLEEIKGAVKDLTDLVQQLIDQGAMEALATMADFLARPEMTEGRQAPESASAEAPTRARSGRRSRT